MGTGPTFYQTTDDISVILQLAHERNAKMASYIRITDGAIWGFLGVAVIELFKDNHFKENMPIFLILLIISMFLWRSKAMKYQEEIVQGYYRIVNCEEKLKISSDIKVRKNLCEKMKGRRFIPQPKTFSDLCQLLEPEKDKVALFFGYSRKYTDWNHTKLNYFAAFIELVALVFLVFCFHTNFLNFVSQQCII
jgi:hypothetical protein